MMTFSPFGSVFSVAAKGRMGAVCDALFFFAGAPNAAMAKSTQSDSVNRRDFNGGSFEPTLIQPEVDGHLVDDFHRLAVDEQRPEAPLPDGFERRLVEFLPLGVVDDRDVVD